MRGSPGSVRLLDSAAHVRIFQWHRGDGTSAWRVGCVCVAMAPQMHTNANGRRYYFLNSENVTAFPPGFQMIAGDSQRRASFNTTPNPINSDRADIDKSQEILEHKAIGFNCLRLADRSKVEGSLFRHALPSKDELDKNCDAGLRLELMFPSCWNGSADSTDHKSHVRYPSLVMEGDCPAAYSLHLPGLFYETTWQTQKYQDKSGRFFLANGDTTGQW